MSRESRSQNRPSLPPGIQRDWSGGLRAHVSDHAVRRYALVTSTAFDEIAVLLDEGYGHEDYVFPNSKGLGRIIDDFLWSASRGDLSSINGLRSFAVEGIKRLRALRESEGRA